MAAPEAGVELLSTKRGFIDLEDQEPIAAPTESRSFVSNEINKPVDCSDKNTLRNISRLIRYYGKLRDVFSLI